MRQLLQEADLSDDGVLVHVLLVDLHDHHFARGVVHHLRNKGVLSELRTMQLPSNKLRSCESKRVFQAIPGNGLVVVKV